MVGVRVFVAGSRAVSRLNPALRERLDRIIEEGHEVLLGDANGADRAVQQYLAVRDYRNVLVHCTGLRCRNNIGNWATVQVAPPPGVHGGFDFYAAKDQRMAETATHGLMLWDGESRGTLANVRNLIRAGRPVVVYLSPARRFFNVKSDVDVEGLLENAASERVSAVASLRR